MPTYYAALSALTFDLLDCKLSHSLLVPWYVLRSHQFGFTAPFSFQVKSQHGQTDSGSAKPITQPIRTAT